jgi:hypothetical protein
VPEWVDLALRIAAAVIVIGGIMWLAFRGMPGRDRDKGPYSASDVGDGPHDGGGGAMGHGGG